MTELLNTRPLPSFEEMLSALAEQVIVAQQVLDEQYLRRLRDFADLVSVSSLSAHFVPSHLAIESQTIECRFITSSETLSEIRLVNQVFSKRFQAQSITHSVHIEVRRSPLGPGQMIVKPEERTDGQHH